MKLPKFLRFPYRKQPLFSVLFFLVLFVPLAFVTPLQDGFEPPKLFLFFSGTALATILFFVRSQRILKVHRGLFIAGGLFLLWVTVSTIFSLDPINSVIGLYGRFTSSLLFYGVWLIFIGLVLSELSDGKLQFLMKTLTVCGLAIAALGLLQGAGIGFYLGIDQPIRSLAPSFMGNPNFNSMFIVGVVPLTFWLLSHAAVWRSRLYYAVAGFVMIWGVVDFASRGSLLALGFELLGLFIVGVLSRDGKRLAIYAAIALVVAGSLFLPFYAASRPNSLGQTVNLSDATVQNRFLVWNEALVTIATYPWFGTGPANFFIAFKSHGTSALSSGERFDDAHNLFLHIAASSGLPSLLAFLLMVFVAVAAGYRQWQHDRQTVSAVLGVALFGLLTSAQFNPVVIACWLLIGFFLAALLYRDTHAVNLTPYRLVRYLGVGLSSLFIIAVSCFIVSEYLSYRAVYAYKEEKYERALRYSQWASRLNPTNGTAVTYWAASRIRMNQDPRVTAEIIARPIRLHARSSGVYSTAQTLYFMLYRQSSNPADRDHLISAMQHELALEPNYATNVGSVAYVYYRLGEQKQALYYARQALVLNPQQLYGWLLLAELYHEQGQFHQSLYAFTRGYEQNPTPQLKILLHQLQLAPNSPTPLPIIFPDPTL